MEKVRICPGCLEKLPLKMFYINKGTNKPGVYCKVCNRERATHSRLSNKNGYNDKIRERVLNRKFGITSEDYDLLYITQGGRCAICGTHQTELKRKLSVDHDHKKGEVRGLLCTQCNQGLGYFKDSPVLTREATNYLLHIHN